MEIFITKVKEHVVSQNLTYTDKHVDLCKINRGKSAMLV